MDKHSKQQCERQYKIEAVEATDEKISGRGGLSLFVRYLEKIDIMDSALLPRFAGLKKSKKGASVEEIFKQVLCNFMDGTSRHLSYFDQLKQDRAYAALIGSRHEDLVSSHMAKRFYRAFSWPMICSFRHIYQDMFIWRLSITQPELIVLDVDAMVMDNDQAEKREGFNALRLTWDGLLVDSVFRSGEKHSNFGDSVQKMLQRTVKRIRSSYDPYDPDVPIIIHMDAGFMDQKIFEKL